MFETDRKFIKTALDADEGDFEKIDDNPEQRATKGRTFPGMTAKRPFKIISISPETAREAFINVQ